MNRSARIYAQWQWEDDPFSYGGYIPYEPTLVNPDSYKEWVRAYTVYRVMLDTTIDSTGKIPEIIVRVKAGDTLSEPKAPIKAGYDFTGWFTDKGRTKPYDFEKKVRIPLPFTQGGNQLTQCPNMSKERNNT